MGCGCVGCFKKKKKKGGAMNERRTLPSFFCFCVAGCLCFSVCLLLVVAGLFFLYCFGLFTSKPYTNVLRWLLLISFALLLHKDEELVISNVSLHWYALYQCVVIHLFFLIHSIFGC
jgi:hypothetical protein